MEISDQHKVALVTGGSSGIGYEIARELARRKYNLILVSNQDQQLTESCALITSTYQVTTWPVLMDLTLAESPIKLYEWCQNEKIEVEVLVNNAGMFFFGEVVETDLIKVQAIISLHTATPVALCTLFGKAMKKRRSGHILNISSIAADLPYPGIVLYSSTKRFLKSFSRALRTEMLDYQVNVTCVTPGAVSTNLYDLDESKRKLALKLGIMIHPEKLAPRIVQTMFRRKSLVIPGFLNRIFMPLLLLIPHGIIAFIRRHSKFLPLEKP